MKLTVSKSKNSTLYYVQKSYRTETGKSSTKTVERLGTIEEVEAMFGKENTIEAMKAYVRELSQKDRELRGDVVVKFSQNATIRQGEQRCYNGGYLFLQKIYHEFGLDYICGRIEKKHKVKYDLSGMLSRFLYTRLLYPGSKLSSLEESKRFLEQPEEDIHQVYRALSLLATEFNEIQTDVYRHSLKMGKRNTSVVYYDLTNYFFEWDEEEGFVRYGHSKEGRPLPIVQMGLFVDREGFPLAMCMEPGNTAETTTLKPMEEILKEKFGLTRMIVCTDGGLFSFENRKNDSIGDRSFVTVQSVKKMNRTMQTWALDATGWHIQSSDEDYDLSEVDEKTYHDTVFYKDRWEPVRMSTGEEPSQRYIITFSFKYRDYLSYVRNRQIDREQKLLDSGRANTERKKSPNDARRFIRTEYCTKDGELAQVKNFSLNQDMIDQEWNQSLTVSTASARISSAHRRLSG